MLEFITLAFMQRALLAGLLTAVTLSLLGVFVVLRRSAFFGDAVAHFAFAGIAVGFLLGLNPVLTAVVVSLLLALGMGVIQRHAPGQSLDTIIGIFFSGAAALGIFIIGLLRGFRVDLFQFLFGDIVAITPTDVVYSLLLLILVGSLLAFTWRPLFKITFNQEIAAVSGVNVGLYEYLFLALLAIATALSIKIVGIILVPALLVIPAATAKNLSQSFRALVLLSAAISLVSVLAGLVGSFYLNTASGATIVLVSIVFFLTSLLLPNSRKLNLSKLKSSQIK